MYAKMFMWRIVMSKGKLYGIGVGPGDSKLLTVKAVETIRNADMIITPKTEKK